VLFGVGVDLHAYVRVGIIRPVDGHPLDISPGSRGDIGPGSDQEDDGDCNDQKDASTVQEVSPRIFSLYPNGTLGTLRRLGQSNQLPHHMGRGSPKGGTVEDVVPGLP
jgi:hypothetical protein